jgi:hypothetical protein
MDTFVFATGNLGYDDHPHGSTGPAGTSAETNYRISGVVDGIGLNLANARSNGACRVLINEETPVHSAIMRIVYELIATRDLERKTQHLKSVLLQPLLVSPV